MPALDHAIAGLLTDLDQAADSLDSTLVMVTSEFGRTPKVNQANGRDHWARVYSMMLAGGGITRGQIYGASDATAAEPARDAVTLEDFLFTVYHQLGIHADEELMAFGTRPIEIIRDGKLVKGIRRLIAAAFSRNLSREPGCPPLVRLQRKLEHPPLVQKPTGHRGRPGGVRWQAYRCRIRSLPSLLLRSIFRLKSAAVGRADGPSYRRVPSGYRAAASAEPRSTSPCTASA